MLAAAERGKIRINELRDDLVGDLRIATTPELGALHVIPALSHWMSWAGRILYMDIQKELINGTLVEVLPDWHMPAYTLHVLTSKREQYPMKVQRCIDALKQYFVQ